MRRLTESSAVSNGAGRPILNPGPVRINVQGAFIVDEESDSPNANGDNHGTRDIRLPNHTTTVSHVAVDVRPLFPGK